MNNLMEEPQIEENQAREMPLSGPALLELMRTVVDKGKSFRFRARGWSMAPFIRDGDVITVSPLKDGLPGTGEVVAFIRPGSGSLVVHRVVARRNAQVLIQGDNGMENVDGLISREYLLARVTRVERKSRRVWLGLGPERYLIAWLSASGWLTPVRNILASVRRLFKVK